jgi:hypothetical protein
MGEIKQNAESFESFLGCILKISEVCRLMCRGHGTNMHKFNLAIPLQSMNKAQMLCCRSNIKKEHRQPS